MFSFFKNAPSSKEVVLQELSEEQLAQVAGGRDNDHDWDDSSHHRRHHHRRHHHHSTMSMTHRGSFITSTTPGKTQYGSHW
jgi:hypothetical protein